MAERLERGETAIEGCEDLSGHDLALEAVCWVCARAKVDLGALRQRFGLDLLGHWWRQIEQLESKGLIRVEGNDLAPTLDGWWVADALARSRA